MSKGMWTKHYTQDGKIFYFNAAQNRSVWTPPSEAVMHEAPNLRKPEEMIVIATENNNNYDNNNSNIAVGSIEEQQHLEAGFVPASVNSEMQIEANLIHNREEIASIPTALTPSPPFSPQQFEILQTGLFIPPPPTPPTVGLHQQQQQSFQRPQEDLNSKRNNELMMEMQAKIDQALLQKQKEITAKKHQKQNE